MEVGRLVSVDGILLPRQLKTHWAVNGLPEEYLTLIEISDYEFKGWLSVGFFDVPEGAKKL